MVSSMYHFLGYFHFESDFEFKHSNSNESKHALPAAMFEQHKHGQSARGGHSDLRLMCSNKFKGDFC